MRYNPMMQFETSINSDQFEQGLQNFEAALGDYSQPFGLIADDVRQMIAEQFATEGRAGGTPWAELAPSTLRRRRERGGGILNNTGALLQSLTDPGSPDHLEAIDSLSLTMGTDLPYAVFHQTGAGWGLGQATPPQSPQRGRGAPMRPILVLTADRVQGWVGFVLRQIQTEMRALGAAELGKG